MNEPNIYLGSQIVWHQSKPAEVLLQLHKPTLQTQIRYIDGQIQQVEKRDILPFENSNSEQLELDFMEYFDNGRRLLLEAKKLNMMYNSWRCG